MNLRFFGQALVVGLIIFGIGALVYSDITRYIEDEDEDSTTKAALEVVKQKNRTLDFLSE